MFRVAWTDLPELGGASHADAEDAFVTQLARSVVRRTAWFGAASTLTFLTILLGLPAIFCQLLG